MSGEVRITTESGSIYEIGAEGSRVRRVNTGHHKRGDEEWLKGATVLPPKVGERMLIILEGLAQYGPDDYGHVGDVTYRETTPVTRIEEL